MDNKIAERRMWTSVFSGIYIKDKSRVWSAPAIAFDYTFGVGRKDWTRKECFWFTWGGREMVFEIN